MENSIKRFFEEAIEITDDPNDKISTKDLKLQYKIFCHKQKIHAVRPDKLLGIINNEYPEIQYVRTAISRRWTFVKLRD